MLKNERSISFSLFKEDGGYGMQFKAVDISVDKNKVIVVMDFSKGIEITSEEGNKETVYAFEPEWSIIFISAYNFSFKNVFHGFSPRI